MTNRIVSRKSAGFTLIELAVVLVTVSIIAIMIIPRWVGDTPKLFGQTQQLLSDIRYTQSLAMTRGKRYKITFSNPNSYSISDLDGNIVNNPSTGSSSTTLTTGIIFNGFTNLPNSLIAFDGRGIPYTNATATTALDTTATILLAAGAVTRTILISPGTGRVVIQ